MRAARPKDLTFEMEDRPLRSNGVPSPHPFAGDNNGRCVLSRSAASRRTAGITRPISNLNRSVAREAFRCALDR